MKKFVVLLLSLLMIFSFYNSPVQATSDVNINSESLSSIEENIMPARMPILTIGKNELERRFTWYGAKAQGYLELAEYNSENDFSNSRLIEASTKMRTDIPAFSSSQAILDNLKPNTEYMLRVRNGYSNYSQIYRFSTKSNGNYSFLLVGDPQIGASKNWDADKEGWENTLLKMQEVNPNAAFLLSAGDQVNHYTNNEYEYMFFIESKGFEGLTLTPVIGNHDAQTSGFSEHFHLPNVTGRGQSVAGSNYYYVYENTLFIVLNSNNMSVAEHRDTIAEAINYAQSEGYDIKWKVVTFHHSIYSVANHSTKEYILQMRNQFSPVLKEFGIDVVLMGHDHVYVRSHIMDGTNPIVQYNEDGSVPSEYVDPKGTLYLTANSSSGSKHYAIKSEVFPYSAVQNQERTPNFTDIKVTDYSFEAITYRSHDKSVVDRVKLVKEGNKPIISQIEQPKRIDVAFGTDIEKINLPEKIKVFLSDGSTEELDILWDTESYDSKKIGNQYFIGNYELPENIGGEKLETKLTIKVLKENVAPNPAPEPNPNPEPTPKPEPEPISEPDPEINYDNVWNLFAPYESKSENTKYTKEQFVERQFTSPSDISGHWAEGVITEILKRGLLEQIDNKFYPNRETSRIEIIKALAILENVNLDNYSGKSLGDIEPNSEEAAIINWAIENGIINGYEDGTFKSSQSVSREEMAKILVQYVENHKNNLDLSFEIKFNDESEISDWAKPYVEKAQRLNLLKGRDDGKFDPKNTLTRGEISQIVYRLIDR